MTLLLPALVLAILLVIVGHLRRTTAITTASGPRRTVIAPAELRIRHWGHDRSARRSMNRYIQTVVADLGSLSLKPASATYAIRAGRRVTADPPLRDVGMFTAATPYTSRRVHSGRT